MEVKTEIKTAYCHDCCTKTRFVLIEEIQENSINGFKFKTRVRNPYCLRCGAGIYPSRITGSNFKNKPNRPYVMEVTSI